MSAAEQQATNAALATLAAAGNSYALGQLWETNRGLIRSMFWKWYPHHKSLADKHGVTADDFEQEGFFAVQYAARTYDPAAGAFSTWLAQASGRYSLPYPTATGENLLMRTARATRPAPTR